VIAFVANKERGEENIGHMAHIMVVDDDEGILKSVGKMLTHLGHDVKTAHDGQEAIELMAKYRDVDCLITDIHMPGMDGYEVADRVRKLGKPDTPVIAITGDTESEIRSGSFNASLLKPFKLKSLVEMVESFI
jgi:CheY-like chemotaxis protein